MSNFGFSDSESDGEPADRIPRQVRMTDDLERQLEELERLQSEMEEQHRNSGSTPLKERPEQCLASPSISEEYDPSTSPFSSPHAQLLHEKRQVRDLTSALATERRARKELTAQVEALTVELISAQEQSQDATERAQQIEEDYLKAQIALSRADSQHHIVRRNSRELAERLRQQQAEPENLADASLERLEELEAKHREALAAVQQAKVAKQQKKMLELQRQCEEMEDKKLCVVCMEASADATFVHGDSGHQVCCHTCASSIKSSTGKCPICNQMIEAVIRHFGA